MTIIAEPWKSPACEATGRQLVPLPLPVMDALANGHLRSAAELFPHKELVLTPYLVSDECPRSVWAMRSTQIKADPRDATWVTRLVVDSETGTIVGRAGYHGQPNQDGMIEVGYAIDPLHRRRGHARAALKILVDIAAGDPRVKVVRATVRPDNYASRNLIDQYGFREIGEQWDEEDGLEKILELSVS